MKPIGRVLESLQWSKPIKRYRRQDVADQLMVDLLVRRYGMVWSKALEMVEYGRDGAPQVVPFLTKISQRHRVGWFYDPSVER